MDSLGRMRASEEELHGETGRSASTFKVFGRPEAEEVRLDEPRATPAPTSTEADDPFAALSNDASDSFGAPPKQVAVHSTRARHEVLEAEFPIAARGASRAAGGAAVPADAPLERARPELPEPPPAVVPQPAPAPPAPLATSAERPDWYRDPAFWVHATPLAGTVLILTGFGLVPGLLIENTAGRRNEFVRDQAREAVNFQLNYLMLNLAALITFTAPVVWPLSLCFGIVLPIQAALDVKNGKRHRYPLVPRWLD